MTPVAITKYFPKLFLLAISNISSLIFRHLGLICHFALKLDHRFYPVSRHGNTSLLPTRRYQSAFHGILLCVPPYISSFQQATYHLFPPCHVSPPQTRDSFSRETSPQVCWRCHCWHIASLALLSTPQWEQNGAPNCTSPAPPRVRIASTALARDYNGRYCASL